MFLRQLFDPDSSTFSYLVGADGSDEVAAIDPVRERVDELLAALEGRRLVVSLETHTHADHVTGASLLRERTGARLGVHHAANACACSDLSLGDGEVVTVGPMALRCLETPGHTPDGLSFHIEAERCLFTGDTLLVGTCGRTDFQGGDAGALWDSLQRLLALPEETVVYPGHDYKGRTSTTVGAERTGNVRFSGRGRAEFVELMNNLHLPPPRQIDVALPANERCGLDGTRHSA